MNHRLWCYWRYFWNPLSSSFFWPPSAHIFFFFYLCWNFNKEKNVRFFTFTICYKISMWVGNIFCSPAKELNLIWMLLFSLMYRLCNCKAIVIWNMLLCRCGSKFHIRNAKNTKNSHISHSIDIRDLHNC